MFQNKLRSILAASLCFISASVIGQNLEKDMTEIAEAMKTASSLSVGVDIQMYSKKGGSLIYRGNASLAKSKESTKSVLAEMEFVNTPSYELRVDHEEKAVLIFKKETPSDSNLPKSEKVDFDVDALRKLMEGEESSKKPTIKLISSSGGIKKYSIKGSSGISEMIVDLDITNKKIKSVIIEYQNDGGSNGQYLVLNYSKFDYNTDVSSAFDLTNYFTEKDNNYVLSQKLKGYHIYTEL